MVDAVGTTAYTYTSGGFLYTEDGPFASDTLTNYYNNRLRVGLGLQQPTGSWTNGFTYDEAKRLTSVTSPAGTFDYYYDSTRLGLVDQLSLPNSSYITNTYDPVARLLGTFLKNSSGTTLDAASYGYNAGNQRTNFLNATGTNVAYTHDPIGQLTSAASTVSTENRGYAYDAAWNLTNLNTDGTATTFSVNNVNELTSVAGTTITYDSNGNLTGGPGGGGATSGTDASLLAATAYRFDGCTPVRVKPALASVVFPPRLRITFTSYAPSMGGFNVKLDKYADSLDSGAASGASANCWPPLNTLILSVTAPVPWGSVQAMKNRVTLFAPDGN